MPNDFFFLSVLTPESQDNHLEVIRDSKPKLTLMIPESEPNSAVIKTTLLNFFSKNEHPATLEIVEMKNLEDDEDKQTELLLNKKIKIGIDFRFASTTKIDRQLLLERRLKKVFLHHEIPPLPHQTHFREKLWAKIGEAVFLSKNPNVHEAFLLYWKVGSGKSYASLQLFSFFRVPRVFIICTNTMIRVWEESVSQMPQPPNSVTRFTILGISEFAKLSQETPQFLSNQIVIFDEAHIFRNATENMLDQIAALGLSRLVLLLTGTPIMNALSDLIGLVWSFGATLRSEDLEMLRGESPFDKERTLAIIDRVFANRVDFYDPQTKIENMDDYPLLDRQFTYVKMTVKQCVDYMLQKRQNFEIGDLCICTSNRSAFNTTAKRISNSSSCEELSPKFLAVCENVIRYNKFPQLIMSSYLANGVVPCSEELQRKLDQKIHPVRLMTGKSPSKTSDRIGIIQAYNERKIDVLGLSEIAETGLTFFNTEVVNLIDSYDNIGTEMQAIHRAARFRSHKKGADGKMPKVVVMKYISIFPPKEEFFQNSDMLARYFFERYCNTKNTTQAELIHFDFAALLVDKIQKEENWLTIDQRLEVSNQVKYETIQPVTQRLQELGSKD